MSKKALWLWKITVKRELFALHGGASGEIMESNGKYIGLNPLNDEISYELLLGNGYHKCGPEIKIFCYADDLTRAK